MHEWRVWHGWSPQGIPITLHNVEIGGKGPFGKIKITRPIFTLWLNGVDVAGWKFGRIA